MLNVVNGTLKLTDTALLRKQAYLNGVWVDAATQFDVTNPADGHTITSVPNQGETEAAQAITAAQAAFPAWAAKTGKERSQLMRKWFDLIIAHTDDLARIMTLEQGKPVGEAKLEVMAGADIIEWFAEEGRRAYGRVIPARAEGVYQLVVKEPVGPVAAFTPWNFPINQAVRKLSAALSTGCSFTIASAAAL